MTTVEGQDLYATFLRKRRGWRQVDLAKACGVDQSRLSLIEQGRLTPTEQQARQIADALNFSPPSALFRPVLVVLPEPEATTEPETEVVP